jgi:heptosyltransferase-1
LLSQFNQKLNKNDYDLVIDLQNNMKSATVSWFYKGDVHGFDKGYCRERFAYKAYKHRYAIPENQHAIKRIRQILSQALAYTLVDTPPDYGTNFEQYDLPRLNFVLPKKYLIFIHNASWLSKIWPLASWQGLINKVVEHGYSVLLPCGNDEEHQRAQQIAAVNEHAHALPRLTLNEIAALTYRADGAMCSDTGLAHLAAVAGIPAQTIYGATDTDLIGTVGQHQQHIVSEMNCAPCYKRTCPRPEAINGEPVCMDEISIETAWHRLKAILPAQ